MDSVPASAVSKGRCVSVSMIVCNTRACAGIGIGIPAYRGGGMTVPVASPPEVLIAVYTGSTSLSLPADFHVMKHHVVGSAGC